MTATTAEHVVDDVQQQNNETVLKLALAFLSIRDLLAVSAVNHHFLKHVRSRNDVWVCFYQEFESYHSFPCLGGALSEVHRLMMRIPPRMHGDKIVPDSFRLHPLDSAARQHDDDDDWGPLLYCMECGTCPYWNIDDESGELLDIFFRMEGAFHQEHLYLPRDFPVFCEDCKVWLYSTEHLIEHCKSDAHLFAREPRLLDPRCKQGFQELSAFERTKALTIYPLSVYAVFREITMSPSSQEEIDVITSNIQRLMRRVVTQIFGPEDYDPDVVSDCCTSDVISEFCIDFVTDAFFSGHEYAFVILYGGWQPESFEHHGLGIYLRTRTFEYLLSDFFMNDWCESSLSQTICMSNFDVFGM
ncbi:unnamed protein product [Cylindrotheca closterium]|uniref:Uncharacterized protein n=1 Tax=Cylindrotheca closterium TaxID=2856 RepID=A0AAD2JLQ2_9STRA|nr:unnamed protein product [Cylindrotheca closterium]